MAMIQDDGTPWTGPGFEWSHGKDNWPDSALKKPAPAVDDMNTALKQALSKMDSELMEEDGTGEYTLVGGEKEE